MSDYRRNNSHISVCNRLLVEKILPQAVRKFNAGGFGKDYFIFQERVFYKEVISNVFSTSIANEFTEGIVIERGRLPHDPYFLVIKLKLPHNNEIGDADIACVLIDTVKNLASVYCMEKSFKDYIICEWAENKHFNYGTASNFTSFLSAIIPLAKEDFKNSKPQNNTRSYDKSADYNDFKSGTYVKKPNSKKNGGWGYVAGFAGLSILIGVLIMFIVERCDSKLSKSPETDIFTTSVDTIQTDTVPTDVMDEESTNEEYFPIDDKKYAKEMEDLVGEVFVYHPEDGSIRTSSGRIVSEGGAPAESYTKRNLSPKESAPKASTPSASHNVYEGVEITHYLSGEYPYYNAYGRGRFDSSSLSKLGISNKTYTDAVLLLCDAQGEVIRNVFVKKGSYHTIKNIPSCLCIMKVMFGNDWYKGKDNGSGFPKGGFIKDESYTVSKWSDAFDFTPQYLEDGIDYPTYEITLHAVRNGNFKTRGSNKNEFFNNKK